MKKIKICSIILTLLIVVSSCNRNNTIDITKVNYENVFQEDEKGIYYKNKLFTGKIVKYEYVDGPLLFEKEYKEGKKDGFFKFYDNDGQIEEILNFSENNLIDYKEYNKDGIVSEFSDNKGNILKLSEKDTLIFRKLDSKLNPNRVWFEKDNDGNLKYTMEFDGDTMSVTSYKKGKKTSNSKHLYPKDSLIYFTYPLKYSIYHRDIIESDSDHNYSYSFKSDLNYLKKGEVKYLRIYEEYYKNGQISYKSNIKEGKKHGPSKQYYDNGNLKSKINFIDGKENGSYVKYLKNGKLEYEVTLKGGKRNGPFVTYYDNGQIHLKGDFKNGKRSVHEEYDYLGRLKSK